MKRYKVLIGSCGGLTGVYLLKQMKRFAEFDLYGFDINENNVGKFFCNDVFKLPVATSDDFVNELVNLLNEKQIDIYVPTHSKEIKKISKNEEYIRKNTLTKFIVSPYVTYQALDDKLDANINLQNINIFVPKVIVNKKDARLPLFAKKRNGSGSSGSFVINTIKEYESVADNDGLIITEYISGKEYTVDCLFSENGNLLGYNQRRRCKTIGGAVSITKNENLIDIEPYIKQIASKWCFKGAVNFQYILHDEKPFFIDINLRYASGGMPLSVQSGVDIPLALKKMLLGEKVGINEFKSDFKERFMYRYFEEVYEDI